MSKIRSVQTSSNTGRYNLAGTEESWCLELRVFFEDGPHLSRSETFDIDDHPELGWGDDPEEVLDALDERMESHWISTTRERNREKSERLRELMPDIRQKWINDRVDRAEKKLASLLEQQAEIHGSEPELFDGVRADLAALTSVPRRQTNG